MRLAGGATWTSGVVATADLTAVVSLTVLSRITVVVNHTFVLANPQLTGLVHLAIAVIAALWLLADMSHALPTLAAVGAVAAPHLTAVVCVTVLCGVAVVVHHTFVLAHA